jgi:hypothetical protein
MNSVIQVTDLIDNEYHVHTVDKTTGEVFRTDIYNVNRY